jgi:hypothetical protein
MAGISLVTKGMIAPIREGGGSGSGGAGLIREQDISMPDIKVTDVTIEGENKEPITEETFKVKSLKIIVEQKD